MDLEAMILPTIAKSNFFRPLIFCSMPAHTQLAHFITKFVCCSCLLWADTSAKCTRFSRRQMNIEHGVELQLILIIATCNWQIEWRIARVAHTRAHIPDIMANSFLRFSLYFFDVIHVHVNRPSSVSELPIKYTISLHRQKKSARCEAGILCSPKINELFQKLILFWFSVKAKLMMNFSGSSSTTAATLMSLNLTTKCTDDLNP